MNVRIVIRPLLVSGMLASDGLELVKRPVIIIDSELPEEERVVSLWHETLHLLGMTNEVEVEAIARELAKAYPTILRRLAPVIEAPYSRLTGDSAR